MMFIVAEELMQNVVGHILMLQTYSVIVYGLGIALWIILMV
ncbi:MAG: hypothetical protein AB8U16_07060 [Rickettsiales endosymbiont of Dermacentor nuttalli]